VNLLTLRRQPFSALQIIPDRSLRNYHVEALAKAFAEFYTKPVSRVSRGTGADRLIYEAGDTFTFEIHLSSERITFYLIVPGRLERHFKQKISSVWDKATVLPAPSLVAPVAPVGTTDNLAACELIYKRHDLFSLNTDKDTNAPLVSLLSCVGDMQEGDAATVQILCEPISRLQWEYDAGKAYERFQKGRMPGRVRGGWEAAGRGIGQAVQGGLQVVFDTLNDFISTDGKKPSSAPLYDVERHIMARKGLAEATKQKPHREALRTWIRVVVQSNDQERARLTMRALAGAYKDISADNELTRKDITRRDLPAFLLSVLEREAPFIKVGANIMSTAEVGKLCQLPTAGLQDEFKQIESISRREVSLPGELFMEDVPGIPIGKVTEKGITRAARVPVAAYQGVQLKHVYDALCTASFGQGKQGSGKSDGYGIAWTRGFVLNGLTAIIIDTADGQVIRNFEDSLPADYPDEKLIHIDLDNKAWPVPLNWSDVTGRISPGEGADSELEALEIAERIQARFREFIVNMASSDFTDRMDQYLTSCMRAVMVLDKWSFLDFELAVKSPSYREVLLQNPRVKDMPGVVDDLKRLQEKAETGSEGPIIEPILARLKILANSQFIENLFYQEVKTGKDGRPVMDFRRWIDNQGGDSRYGYTVCIQASSGAWGGEDVQALLLGFFEDKINFNVFSRVDTDQANRRPVLKWIDEPHKVIKKVAKYYRGSNVEFRKYRCKNVFTGHSIDQMGDAAKSLLDGGAQFTSYKTESLKDLERLAHVFAPYDDPKELYTSLPEKWEAVNKVRLPSGKDCPAFIARMEPPPAFVRSREQRRQECSRVFGRHWREVRDTIQRKRLEYQERDSIWYIKRKKAIARNTKSK